MAGFVHLPVFVQVAAKSRGRCVTRAEKHCWAKPRTDVVHATCHAHDVSNGAAELASHYPPIRCQSLHSQSYLVHPEPFLQNPYTPYTFYLTLRYVFNHGTFWDSIPVRDLLKPTFPLKVHKVHIFLKTVTMFSTCFIVV